MWPQPLSSKPLILLRQHAAGFWIAFKNLQHCCPNFVGVGVCNTPPLTFNATSFQNGPQRTEVSHTNSHVNGVCHICCLGLSSRSLGSNVASNVTLKNQLVSHHLYNQLLSLSKLILMLGFKESVLGEKSSRLQWVKEPTLWRLLKPLQNHYKNQAA